MPVYSSHTAQSQDLAIGRRIRLERKRRGITLRELSGLTGISQSQLSNIEAGKALVTLRQMYSVASVLGVGSSALLPPSQTSHYVLHRSSEISAALSRAESLSRKGAGGSAVAMETQRGPGPQIVFRQNTLSAERDQAEYETASRLVGCALAASFVGKRLEPFWTRSLAASAPPDMLVYDAEMFLFVLSGEAELLIRRGRTIESHPLRAGSAVYVGPRVPHTTYTKSAAEVVSVQHWEFGPADGILDELGGPRQPIYGVDPFDDPVMEAGKRIGFVRRTRGLSLQRLAARVGIGARQLAAIETGRSIPDLPLLYKLARAVRLPIETFLADADADLRWSVLDAQRILEMRPRRRGGDEIRSLIAGVDSGFVHPYLVRLRDRRVKLIQHPGQSFVYVLQGNAEYISQDAGGAHTREVLHAGDSLFFDSTVPYDLCGCSANASSNAGADIIHVVWNPSRGVPPSWVPPSKAVRRKRK